MSDPNLLELAALGAKASISRHIIRSLSASQKRLNKEKKKSKKFIIDSLTKGEIRWKSLSE